MWDTSINGPDRVQLRDLARKVAEIASEETNAIRREMWRRHNRLEVLRPMVRVCPEGAWCEIMPEAALRSSSPLSRWYETDLRRRIHYRERLQDDSYISAIVYVPIAVTNTRWGISARKVYTDQTRGSYTYDHPIKEPDDWLKMKPPRIELDEVETQRRVEIVADLFGDILDVKPSPIMPWDFVDTYLTDTLASLRGNQQLMLDMCDRPEWVHEVMGFMSRTMQDVLDRVPHEVRFDLNNCPHGDGMGSLFLTDELPAEGFDGKHVRLCDLWGDSNAQEYAGLSPQMHYEFGLQYQIPLLARFGLVSYGCCEPLDRKLDYVKRIPNLRRISISPWADVRRAAEALEDRYIFSWKPNPAWVADDSFHPDPIRARTRDAVRVCREHGCVMEMTLKDTHTVRNQSERLDEWVRIALEEARDGADGMDWG